MAEDSPSGWQKTLDVLNAIGILAAVGGVAVTSLGWWWSWPGWAVGSSVTATLLGVAVIIARIVSLRADAPIESIGEWRQNYVPVSAVKQHATPPSLLALEKPNGSLTLEEIERHYELKKLEPNLQSTSLDPEIVAARFDKEGIILVQPLPEAEGTFDAHVVPLTNAGTSRVGEAKKVRARITFRDFDQSGEQSQSGTVHRGAWLSEKETEIDFPPYCSPRRLVLITVEGKEPPFRVFSISRDFDSSYNGTLTMREELHGEFYEFKVALFDQAHATKPLRTFEYILQISHLWGAFSVSFSQALFWKSKHLHGFIKEGFAFSAKVHEIWEDAQKQVPFPPVDPNRPIFLNYALIGADKSEPFDYAAAQARIRAIEQEEEGKLLDAIKNWEAKAAEFVGRFISADHRDQFLKCGPSIEDGFNRTQKSVFRRLRFAPLGKEPPPPEPPYWMLSDAISSRTEKLMKISEQLK
jgi:hypothetical protein